jgi:Protein of Unknown function (DUF2784)
MIIAHESPTDNRAAAVHLGLWWAWISVPAGEEMWYRIGADIVVVVHLFFLGFVVGGAFLTWRWPWTIWVHIPTVVYTAIVVLASFTCPLTALEKDLRHQGGEVGYTSGFIAHYLVPMIYPAGLTQELQDALGGVLLLLAAIIGYLGSVRRHGWAVALRVPWLMGSRPAHKDG